MQNEYIHVNSTSYDEGLRKYMLGIYNYMLIGLIITACTSLFAASSESFMSAAFDLRNGGLTGLGFILTLLPLGLALSLQFAIHKMKPQTAQMVFMIYSAAMGLSLSTIFLFYTGQSIAKTFFITASTFGAMSFYGYTTKKDLTSMGSFMFMGLIGVILASLVNMFLKSSGLEFIISIFSVIIFTGLTAFDTQNLKNMYNATGSMNEDDKSRLSILGALMLYLDFINLFISLLKFFGDRRES
jgi:FtsH-binding integral membrane protein